MKLTILFLWVILAIQLPAQVSKTVEPAQPGTLYTYITAQELSSITSLTLKGKIDARDFAFLRDKMKNLATLNMALATINAYTGTQGTVTGTTTTYPAGEIPAFAFYNPVLLTYMPGLTSVTMPATAISVGEQAFYFSWNLASMTIPNSVKKIGDYAFYGCYALSSFTVASSHTWFAVDQGILYNKAKDTLFLCPNARTGNLVLPSTVKHIGTSAFENCYNLTTVTLPTSLVSTGSYAFAYCSGISGNLSLPTSLKTLGDGTFYGCYNLTGTVTLPALLTKMGSYCFFESNGIQAFSVNTSNTRYSSQNGILYNKQADSLFICPAGKTGTLSIPSSVRYIGSHAFYGCKNLTGSLTIPDNTDYIEYYAFNGCTALQGINVSVNNTWFTSENGILYSKNKNRLLFCPTTFTGNFPLTEGLISIDPGAFYSCTGISGPVIFPESLSWIGEYAFYNCPGISGFEVHSANPWYSAEEGVLLNKAADTLYICPIGKTGTYTLPSTIKHISYAALSGCTGLTGIIAHAGLRSLGTSAFAGCTSLSNVFLPSTNISIGYGAFYSCTALSTFSIAQATPPLIDYYTFDLANQNIAQLLVPTNSKVNYQQAPYWQNFVNISETTFESAVSKQALPPVRISPTPKGIRIQGIKTDEQISIYNTAGQLLLSFESKSELPHEYTFPNKGIFILKNGHFTEKFIR